MQRKWEGENPSPFEEHFLKIQNYNYLSEEHFLQQKFGNHVFGANERKMLI
jgi:hypothetical protein